MTRILPLLPALLLLAGGARPALARVPLAAIPISRMQTPWWRQRFDAKRAELARVQPELIFLGNSITQDFEREGGHGWDDFRPVWQRFYGDRRAVNLGFKGDATSHLLWRMRHGELDGIHPKVAVVLIGANDFGRPHWDAADTMAGIAAVVTELHARLPQTRVLLLSVLPSRRSAWVDRQTTAVNALLAHHDWDGAPVTFLDLTPVFAPGGRLDEGLFLDQRLTPPDPPLHPTAEGQARMAAAIEPTLSRLLGDRNHLQGKPAG